MEFPSPHAIAAIPGTEGWERMYPYQYQFVTDDPVRVIQIWFIADRSAPLWMTSGTNAWRRM